MKFSTVFFDVDCCLLDTPRSEHRIIKELYGCQGQVVGNEVGECYRKINRKLWVFLDRGEITREELYVRRFQQLFEIYPHIWPAKEAASWFLKELADAHDPQEGAKELLERLKREGVRVFTASNGIGAVMNRRVEMAGLSEYLTGRFAADEIGAMKPSRQYFEYIFRHCGETDINKVLMVGDNPVTDVNGAVDYGMTGVLFGLRWEEPSKAAFATRTMKELEAFIFE